MSVCLAFVPPGGASDEAFANLDTNYQTALGSFVKLGHPNSAQPANQYSRTPLVQLRSGFRGFWVWTPKQVRSLGVAPLDFLSGFKAPICVPSTTERRRRHRGWEQKKAKKSTWASENWVNTPKRVGSGWKIPSICTVNRHIFPPKDIPYSGLQIPFLIEGFSVVPSREIHFGILIQRLFYFTGILNYEFDCRTISLSCTTCRHTG